jgi:ADP-heptose:LPS heptosyltransferase
MDGIDLVKVIFSYNRLGDLKRIRDIEYDCIFDTEQSHLLTGTLVALLKGYKKIGFATEGRERAYDISVQYFHDEYEANSFSRLFAAGIENWPKKFQLRPPYFSPTDQERRKVDSLLANIKREVVCMFPGASIKERPWPIDRWGMVADELSKYGCQPIIIKGERHRIINRNLECSPCTKFGTTPPCQNNMACMMEISSEEVLGASMGLLQKL